MKQDAKTKDADFLQAHHIFGIEIKLILGIGEK